MRARGFTLVEALVAVGIVALLAALVFGVLAPARGKAREVQCAGVLRQWGQAHRMYAQDWDAREPVVGVPMQWYEIGLPADAWVFMAQYGLTKMMQCPAEKKHAKPPFMYGYATPGVWLHFHAEDAPRYIAAMGSRLSLVRCDAHNGSYDLSRQDEIPSWYAFKILILRYNQSLSWSIRELPLRGDPFLR